MKKGRILVVILVIVLILAVGAGMFLYDRYSPTKEREDLLTYYGVSEADDVAVIRDHVVMSYFAKSADGALYLPYQIVHDSLNERFFLDPEGLLIYTLDDREAFVSTGETGNLYYENVYANGSVTQNTIQTNAPVVRTFGDTLYLSLDFVQQFTDMDVEYIEDPERLVLTTGFGEQTVAEVTKKTALRVRGGIKSPILLDLATGDVVTILEEEENWVKAEASGVIGYVEKKRLSEPETITIESDFLQPEFHHLTFDGTVRLLWHQVTNTDVNAKIGDTLAGTKGVNVVSPTWFYLNDSDGGLMDLASRSYVDYCHNQGIQVWGLVSNLENKEIDDEAVILRNSTRRNFVKQITEKATEYGLDGINLDFEAISSEAGEAYVQLIRELSVECQSRGLILSVDNYVPTEYSGHYNRTEQALYADYLIIMGYDEHYNGSDEGSVASLPWVTAGVEETISQMVPAEQVILGMPFYTRVWTETPKTGASDLEMASEEYVPYELSSRTVGMNEEAGILERAGATPTWLNDVGQYYAEWISSDGLTNKMWMEESESIAKKIEVVSNFHLAGGAFWKATLESPEVWDVIEGNL